MKVSKSFINKPINQKTHFLLLGPFVEDTKCMQKMYKQSCIHPKNWIEWIVNNNKKMGQGWNIQYNSFLWDIHKELRLMHSLKVLNLVKVLEF
jgi:hypothetical protein